MAIAKHVRIRVRILVKAFPQPSEKHEETVCCAGITEDGRQLLRLFPIRYRRLPKEHQFERFDLVEMTATKASDPRPESYRVDEASIQLVESGKHLTDEAKVQLWQPFIASSLKELYADNRATNRSLGIVKPDPGSITFTVKPAKDAGAADLEVAEQVRQMQQSSFLEDPLTPLEKPEFAFEYQFTSAAHPHGPMMIHDWEVQEAYRQYKRRYGADALDHLQRMYGETIPARNLHLIMGTMLAHPRTFIIIGLLRSGLDPAELAKQGKLF
jgi:hypothetical protein